VQATAGFAESLLREGEYYRAATEYFRARHLCPPQDQQTLGLATTGIGVAHYMGGDFGGAVLWLEDHLHEARGSRFWPDAQLTYLSALIECGRASDCVLEADRLGSPEGELMRGVGLAHSRSWQLSLDTYETLPADHKYSRAIQHNAMVLANAKKDNYRSSTLAAILGFIPGLGYAYASHPQSAISAFLMNSLLAYGTYEAWDAEHHALGSVTGFLAITWYAGSIYGSAKAAERYNNRKAETYLDNLSYMPEWAMSGCFPPER